VPGLMLRCGLREAKDAPVGVSADDAAGAEDLDACITGDSGGVLVRLYINAVVYLLEEVDVRWYGWDRMVIDVEDTYSRTSLRLPGRT
jgi:hypothetical protein